MRTGPHLRNNLPASKACKSVAARIVLVFVYVTFRMSLMMPPSRFEGLADRTD